MGVDDKQKEGMRWLYDDDRAYEKAVRKLEQDELREKNEKRLLRDYKKRQRRILAAKIKGKVKKIVLRAKAAYTPRRAVIAGVVLLVVIAGLGIVASREYKQKATKYNQGTVTADFKPAVPEKTEVQPQTVENNNFKIVTYQDTYNKISLIVSQQKLPDQFYKNPAAIKELDQFKNADEVDTSKGKIYVTSNPSGQQWASMVYGNILLFIQTSQRMSDSDWFTYIGNLKVQ